MFSKKIVTVIELSDETKQALAQLDNDMQVLEELTRDVIANQVKVLAALTGEITAQVPVADDDEEGVVVFAEDAPTAPWDGATVSQNTDNEKRTSPFTRAPRGVQIEWLMQVIGSGEWYSAYGIARAYATDERHLRYMKGALGGRLREMWEEGICERRDSHTKGSMYEYRLKR